MWGALIGAITGQAAGLIGTAQQVSEQEKQFKLQKEQLERQKEGAWQEYLLGRNNADKQWGTNQSYAETQWGINKSEALSQLSLQESRLGRALDQGVAQYNTGLLGQAYGIQDAQIRTAGSTGMSVAAEGASGTRGNEAPGLARAYEETSLARQVALQKRGNQDSLSSMLQGAGDAREDIERERDSWSASGYRGQEKAAQDRYNISQYRTQSQYGLDLANKGQADYDQAIKDAEAQYNLNKIDFWDGLATFISGGNTGFIAGNSIDQAAQYRNRPTAVQEQSFTGVGYDGTYTHRIPDYLDN
jgi:gas vesicle protein